ncbi:MAG: acetate--CoA ligase family protein [Hyphomicrobiales bacterium]|nr:acetate--CoA ligase family protein [Hyphomicrobiales bacterium]
MTHSLTRLLSPKTVAVIGGRVAESVIVEMDKLGYTGDIWPVNPGREKMAGRKCFASVADLPQAPDCAYVAVSRAATIETLAALAEISTGGAIAHASGFSEVGEEGAAMTADFIAAAGDMPVLGPNCWGVLNLFDKAALWPDFHGAEPCDKGVAIVNQSGNMAINYTMQRRGLPLGMVVTLGNQAMLDANDCLEAFLDDDRISAIGLHIEGLNDLARFSELAIRAQRIDKPIVALKTGTSAKAARAAISHTATMVGADDLYDALFRRHGIARAHSVPGFLETLKLLSVTGRLKGNRIASLSCSGGEASLIADAAERRGLMFPDLSNAQTERIRATLNEFVDVTNPLDYHTFIWGKADELTATFAAMMRGSFDITALIIDYPRADRSRYDEYDMAIDAWIAAKDETRAKTAIIATLPECLPEPVAIKLMANDVVPFAGMDEALDAIKAASGLAAAASNNRLTAPGPPPAAAMNRDEWASKLLLAEHGLQVPRGIASAANKAAKAVGDLAYPVVVKALSARLAHKTDRGAVRLNLKNRIDVERAAEAMQAYSTKVLVEEMVVDGVAEMIIGIDRDPQFGLFLMIGAGGTEVELWKDTTTILLPATKPEIEAAVRSLRIWPLLNGYRGRPKGDLESVVNAIANAARFAEANAAKLAELDINPLIVRPEGKGAIVADALIVMGE